MYLYIYSLDLTIRLINDLKVRTSLVITFRSKVSPAVQSSEYNYTYTLIIIIVVFYPE